MTKSPLKTLKRAPEIAGDSLRGRRDAICARYTAGGPPIPAEFVPDIEPTERDVEIARRLLRAYVTAPAQ